VNRIKWLFTVSAIVMAIGAVTAQPRPVTLLVPPFEGPGALGVNVSTVLNLQVWQTLRKAPFPNPQNLNFGDGLVTWMDEPLESQTHEAALRAATENKADVVLWGKARPYGSGVVVQSYLTINPPSASPIWRLPVERDGQSSTINVGLPRLRYEFTPLELRSSIVENYRTPDALGLYSSRDSGNKIGTVGSFFTALEQNGDAALVRSGDRTGWIRLPSLSSNRSEIVDFVGGIMRIMRADWSGASALFAKVIANPRTPTAVRLDAHLYRIVALERSGSSGAEEARRAHALNPYDRATVCYLVMSQIASANRLPADAGARTAALSDAVRVLENNRSIFSKTDPWFAATTKALVGR
jgi:hypothetical protein